MPNVSVASLKGKMTASRMKSSPLSEIWKSSSSLSNDKIRKLPTMAANKPPKMVVNNVHV